LVVTDTRADCIGGGFAYVGHGEDCVMVAFTEEVGWWRNSVWFTPEEGRRLAERLLVQVEHAEALTQPDTQPDTEVPL
jgi:hypothetical protein